MKNTITITFETDRELTQFEIDTLMEFVAVQVEEPQVMSTDPTNISEYEDADYGVFSVKVTHTAE